MPHCMYHSHQFLINRSSYFIVYRLISLHLQISSLYHLYRSFIISSSLLVVSSIVSYTHQFIVHLFSCYSHPFRLIFVNINHFSHIITMLHYLWACHSSGWESSTIPFQIDAQGTHICYLFLPCFRGCCIPVLLLGVELHHTSLLHWDSSWAS